MKIWLNDKRVIRDYTSCRKCVLSLRFCCLAKKFLLIDPDRFCKRGYIYEIDV